jgi:hypothetical protein
MNPASEIISGKQCCLRACFFLLALTLPGLLLPAVALAQVTYTGTSAAQNFGSVAIGTPSAATTFSFSVAAGTAVGSITVVTQGVPNMDFNNAAGGTCTATEYASSTTCTVNVTFTPKLAGTRYGAVVFSDDSGNVLATAYLQGTGTGPQVNYLPGTESTIGSGFNETGALTVDGSGNLYVEDINNSRVLKETWTGSGYTQSTFLSGGNLFYPTSVDGAGNLYMVSNSLNQVQKWTWTGSGYVQTTIGSGFYGPSPAVADGAGNVYIADHFNGRVVKETLSAGSYTQSVILTCGTYDELIWVCPSSVAVDGSGNVYVSAWSSSSTFDSSKILKMTPSAGGYTQSTIGSGMDWANQVVVDGSGNLFVADDNNSRILRETLVDGSYIQSTVTTSALEGIYGIAVDGSGNLYIANTFYSDVLKEDLADAPSLSFPTATPVGSTDTTDGTQTVQVQNIGNEALVLTSLSYPADFPEASGDANACAGSTSLSPGLMCDLPIEFAPERTGTLSEDVTLTDNALNVTGAQQSVAVSGTATGSIVATHLSVSAPANVGADAPFTMTVTALDASGGTATGYAGTVSFTSTDSSAVLPAASTLTAGVGTFQVTLKTLGDQTITATDAANSFTATSGTIDVSSTPPGVFPGQASANLGSQAIGSATGAQTLSFTIGAGTTVGSIGVVTQGAPNLDFTSATGGTCTATTYASATTCTVDVTFAPKFAGVRKGAVVFFSSANSTGIILGSVPVYGVGTGPQIAYGPGVATAITPTANGQSISNPTGVAVDGAGDLFISIWDQNRVVEVPAGGGAATVIDPTANGISIANNHGVAVDGAGDLFIADLGNNRVVEVPAGGGTATAIDPIVNGEGLNSPTAVAIDGVGGLFIADTSNDRVLEIPAGGGAPIVIDPTVNGKTLDLPYRLAFDAAGDLFIADANNNRVVEVPAGGGTPIAIDPTVNGEGLQNPTGVAVDGAGDLFIADNGNSRIVDVPAGGGAATAIDPTVNGASLSKPWDITFDGAGDLFIADFNNSRIVEIHRSQPPAVNFPTATGVGSIDIIDGPLTAQVQNVGNEALTFTAISYPADFIEASGDPSSCTGTTSLSAGQQCDIPVEFAPEQSGALSESVTLTDNALDVAGTEQSIGVSGNGVAVTGVTHFTLTTTASVVAGIPFNISITALNSINQTLAGYDGTVTFTSSDAGFVNPGPVTLKGGVAQIQATLGTGGTQTIAATDTEHSSWTGSGSFAVTVVSHLSITPLSITPTAPVVSGLPIAIAVTAQTSTNQTVIGDNDTVSFTSSDPAFVNPGPLTLSSGTGVTTVTLETAGTQTITATDTTHSAWTASSSYTVLGAVKFNGTAANQNFGSVAIGSTSAAQTFNFSILAGTTVGSISVVTQGAPNLDFNSASGGTCTATTYTSATTCTVDVTFTPKFAGVRKGAVVFFSSANSTGIILGSVPVYGVGSGPQMAYGPGVATAIVPFVMFVWGDANPTGVAVDGAGDLFISIGEEDRVAEVPASSAVASIDPTVNGEGLNSPTAVAIDGVGDLFIVDSGNNRVVEAPAGGAATAIDPTVNGEGLNSPTAVAIDGVGDLFIADASNNRVLEIPAGGGAPTVIDPTVNGKGLSNPFRVAFDAAGDLFVADAGNNRVVEVPAGGGAAIAIDPTVNGEGLNVPDGVAVDGAGDLFIADRGNYRLVEVPAGGGAPTVIDPTVYGASLSTPWDITFDGAGDLFIADSGNSRVVEIHRSQPPAVNFPTPTAIGSADTTDGTQTVQIQNIGNQALDFTALNYPADFPEASGDSNACTGSTSLNAGQECDVPIQFTPENAGVLSENVTLTDNALNEPNAQQSIAVDGNAPASPVLTSPRPGSTLGVSNITFTWTAGTGVSIYGLWLGVAGPGSSDFYSSGMTTAASVTVPRLPALGVTLYARLFWELSGSSVASSGTYYADYTYTLASPVQGAITSPTPGSILGTSNITFTWAPDSGFTHYDLTLGINGPGSTNMYNSGETTATSVVVPSLPALGVTIYARLYSRVTANGVWQYTDYTYTMASPVQGALTSPTPGSTLGTSNITFTWTPGSGFTHYALTLGISGPGSSDLYNSGETTATSVVVPTLPKLGVTLYARLYSRVTANGYWQYTDYTYKLAP